MKRSSLVFRKRILKFLLLSKVPSPDKIAVHIPHKSFNVLTIQIDFLKYQKHASFY
jgi:hypothetical protein